jgi:hypothetical protein
MGVELNDIYFFISLHFMNSELGFSEEVSTASKLHHFISQWR